MSEQKNPRVLLITKCFDVGGTESHVRSLANGLSKMGTLVIVASQPGRQCELLDKSIPFEPIRLGPLSLISNLLRIAKLIRTHKINVIHAHSRRAITFGTIASIIFGLPLIITVHGRPKIDLRSRLARYQASKIIMVKRDFQHQIQHWALIGKKLTTIPNGCSLTTLPALESKNHISFVYISRIDRKHFLALELLINEFKSDGIKERASLKIVGDGSFSTKLKKIISDASAKNINYVGYQEDPSVFLKDSLIVIGVGKVAIEGLCAGKTVYTLNGGTHRGQLVTADNFERLLDANFVDNNGRFPDPLLIREDIKSIITKASQGKLPIIENEQIQSLSATKQFTSTLDTYKFATKYDAAK